MKLYTLIEDSKTSGSAFLAEHGLSFYFEHNGLHVLFDTGASDTFIYNATLLGIDLVKVDICIISHAHNDHSGGLAHFLDINKEAKVYIKSAAVGEFYTKHLFKLEPTGIDKALLEKYADRLHYFDDDIEITDGLFAASVTKYRHLPIYAASMFEKRGEEIIKDDLNQELFVAVRQKDSVVVLTGCAHHGVLNILMTAEDKFGRVSAVIGGFHLSGKRRKGNHTFQEPASEIQAIIKYLELHKIKKVYTGHCIGERAFDKLELMVRAERIHAGDIIEI